MNKFLQFLGQLFVCLIIMCICEELDKYYIFLGTDHFFIYLAGLIIGYWVCYTNQKDKNG